MKCGALFGSGSEYFATITAYEKEVEGMNSTPSQNHKSIRNWTS